MTVIESDKSHFLTFLPCRMNEAIYHFEWGQCGVLNYQFFDMQDSVGSRDQFFFAPIWNKS